MKYTLSNRQPAARPGSWINISGLCEVQYLSNKIVTRQLRHITSRPRESVQ